MKKDRIISLIVCFILLITLVILILSGNISWFDDPIYKFLISLKSNTTTKIMKMITRCANSSTIIILCLTSLFAVLKKYKGSLFLIGNVIISTVLNLILKNIICRPRPDHLRLITETGYSFPSGHAMASVAFYGFIIFLIINSKLSKSLKWITSSLLTLLIMFVGVSRIYLGVHYPSDILGGYLIGIILILITSFIINKYWRDDL